VTSGAQPAFHKFTAELISGLFPEVEEGLAHDLCVPFAQFFRKKSQ